MSGDDNLTLADFMPHQAVATADGGYRATAGQARDGLGQVAEDKVLEALKSVHDPEIPVNIYDLGLIYEVNRFDDGNVHITMAKLAEVGQVDVDLVWSPAWTKDRMSEDAKFALDMF